MKTDSQITFQVNLLEDIAKSFEDLSYNKKAAFNKHTEKWKSSKKGKIEQIEINSLDNVVGDLMSALDLLSEMYDDE